MSDWHRGEKFASNPDRESKDYQKRLETLRYIHDTYGGEIVVMPGDIATGKWHDQGFINKTFPGYSPQESVLEAGTNCFGTIRQIFEESGWDKLLIAVGDHELGDNYWEAGGSKLASLPYFREAFSNSFYGYGDNGKLKYMNSIGNADSRPKGTVFEGTSFAYQHENVLFVTVDVYQEVKGNMESVEKIDKNVFTHTQVPLNTTQGSEYIESSVEIFFDRDNSLGGEGVVSATLEGEHLVWFENVLREGEIDDTIDYMIVQAHTPVLVPTRKVSSSAMFFDRGTNSEFWQLMQKYRVNVFLAGEVHTVTASQDSSTNLVQIISRANFNNGFLKFIVNPEELNIISYNEFGEKGRDNRQYEENGSMIIKRNVTNQFESVKSDGVLELIRYGEPLIHYTFDESMPLSTRRVDGMGTNKDLEPSEIDIRGMNCNTSIPNYGEFGQNYDAQYANVELHVGIMGSAAKFQESSRMAVYGLGPHTGGTIISYAFFLKTKGDGEMILVHYAPKWNLNQGGDKDIFTLTLDHGTLKLYLSTSSTLRPKESHTLNDGKWHSIAITMPKESCHLSMVKMIIDGIEVETKATNSRRIYFVPHGHISFGGLGYSNTLESDYPTWNPYVGKIDEFLLWTKKIDAYQVSEAMGKTFEVNEKHKCMQNTKRFDFVKTEEVAAWHCSRDCREEVTCIGYEVKAKANGNFRCLKYSGRTPRVGKEVTLKEKPDCAVLI